MFQVSFSQHYLCVIHQVSEGFLFLSQVDSR